ncbi:hypothetical protein SK128_005074, partial [Halocaridina rubra]
MANARPSAYKSFDKPNEKKGGFINNHNRSETGATTAEVSMDLEISTDSEQEPFMSFYGKRKNKGRMRDSSREDNSVGSVENPRKKSA